MSCESKQSNPSTQMGKTALFKENRRSGQGKKCFLKEFEFDFRPTVYAIRFRGPFRK